MDIQTNQFTTINRGNTNNDQTNNKTRKKDLNIISKILFGQNQTNTIVANSNSSSNNNNRLSVIDQSVSSSKKNSIINDMNAVNNNLRNLNKLNTMNNITSTRKRNYDDSLDNSLNSNNMSNTRTKIKATSSNKTNFYSSIVNIVDTDDNNASKTLTQNKGQKRKTALNANKKKIIENLSISNSKENMFKNNNNGNIQLMKKKPASSVSPKNIISSESNITMNNKKYNPIDSIEYDSATYRNSNKDDNDNDNKSKSKGNNNFINDDKTNIQFSTSMKAGGTNFIEKIFPHIFPRTKTFHYMSKISDRPFSSIMLNSQGSNSNNINKAQSHKKVNKYSSNKNNNNNNNNNDNNNIIQPLTQYFLPTINSMYTPINLNQNPKHHPHYQQQSTLHTGLNRPYSHIQKSTNFDLKFGTSSDIGGMLNSNSNNNNNNNNNNTWFNNYALLSNRRLESGLGDLVNNTNNNNTSTKKGNNNNSKDNNALNIILNLNSSGSNINSNSNNSISHTQQDKKKDYFKKMEKMNEGDFEKIMEVVDKLELTKKAIHSVSIPTNPNISSTQPQSNIFEINNDLTSSFLLTTRSKSTSLTQISFYLISSYNIYANQIGLTEIELFDKLGNKIPIVHSYATSFNNTNNNNNSNSMSTITNDINKNLNTILVKKLFNNTYHTTNENDMWVSPFLPDLRVEVFIDNSISIHKIIIWNYNGKDLNKGVKEMQIYKKNILIWKGIVNKGCYNDKIDYGTVINLSYFNVENFEDKNNSNNNIITTTTATNSNKRNKYYSARKAFYSSSSNNSTNSARNKIPFSTNTLLEMNSMNNSLNVTNESYINLINSTNNNNNNNSNTNSEHKNILLTSVNLETSNNNNIINDLNINSLGNSRLLSSKKVSTITPVSPLKAKNKFITFNHIIITLTSNYGHRKYIGLTGIQFYDENSNMIDIETASTIGANPKDIRSYYDEPDDVRIFENVFNNKNQTDADDQMWLTVIKPNEHLPYIELTFTNAITISKIKFYNYNSLDDLDKCVKTLSMQFYLGNDTEPFESIDNIVLYPGIGDSYVDYGQDISFPYTKNFTLTPKELEPYSNIKLASFLYEQCFETPYLPCGFVLRFSFISNYGDDNEIGVDKIELYDQLGRDIISKYRSKIRIETNSIKINNNNTNNVDKNVHNKNYKQKQSYEDRTEMLLKYNNTALENNEDTQYNNVYMFFRIPIGISFIKITNHGKEPKKGVKNMKVYMDGNVIYDGYLNKKKEEDDKEDVSCNDKGETIILFTCEIGITKFLDDEVLAKPIKRVQKKEVKNGNEVVLKL